MTETAAGQEADYDPEQDPGVARLAEASTEEDAREIERELIEQTDNRPTEADPGDAGE